MNVNEIFQMQILIFMTKKIISNEALSNSGICIEEGSAQAVAHIIFPVGANEDPQEVENKILGKVYGSYCIGESMQGIAKF
jgi:hypothetical protein